MLVHPLSLQCEDYLKFRERTLFTAEILLLLLFLLLSLGG
jgi:hypothetical protein